MSKQISSAWALKKAYAPQKYPGKINILKEK
jgi:hypothetical protein